MSPEDCRQTLGVSADAGPQAIRQAYIDLARVWHPDRFGSDARLRRLAEERFKQVNQAYTTLRDYRVAPSVDGTPHETAHTSATPMEDAPHAPPEPAWMPRAARRSSSVFGKHGRFDSMGQYALIVLLVCAPFFAAFNIVPLLRTPFFDSELVATRAFRPRILEPMRSIDASGDVRTVANTLTEWAHGDVIDLWKPVGTEAPQTHTESTRAPRVRPLHKDVNPPPASGADLLPMGRGGAGELGLSNRSNLEAIVKLVGRNHTIVRAVYVAPNASTVIHSIGIGVYSLFVDLGHDLDVEHLRFESHRFTPTPLGPFQFAEITSEVGVSGNRYDVILSPR